MNSLENPLSFITAGKAIFTVKNEKTGNRFTFRVKKCDDKDVWFVGVLTGNDNSSHYSYLGTIFNKDFVVTAKSKFKKDSIQVVAFNWIWRHLLADDLPDFVHILHEGRCGRCGRRLTVPESILSGFGPECANRMGV